MEVQVGEIVWARVKEEEGEEEEEESAEKCWWAGLIERVDNLGVVVSFFDLHTPRYFHHSQIHSFEPNFRSLYADQDTASICGTRKALLDSALCFLCRKTARRLRCRCQSQTAKRDVSEPVQSEGGGFKAKWSFMPNGVLGFVRNAAVSNWVEVGDFVGAAKKVAEIHAFRGYRAIKQKSIYQKAMNEGDRKHSLAEKSYALELDSESSLLPTQKKTNMVVGVPNRINATVLLSEEPLQPMHEDRLDTRLTQAKQVGEQQLCKMLADLHCLALDSSCLQVWYLNIVEQNFLRFRKLSFRKVSDVHISRCSPLKNNEHQSSLSESMKSQQTVKIDGENCGSILPNKESPVDQLGYKQLLDQPDVCGPLKFSKTLPFFLVSGAGISLQINRTGSEADSPDDSAMRTAVSDPSKLHQTTPFFSCNGSDTCAETNRTGCKESLFQNIYSEYLVKLEIQNPSIHVSTCNCSNSSADSVLNTSNNVLQKDSAHQRNIVEIGNVQEPNQNISSTKDTCVSEVKVQEHGGSICLPKNRTCISFAYDIAKKMSNEYSNEDAKAYDLSLLQPSTSELVFGAAIGTDVGTTTKDIDDCAATGICPLQSHQTHDKKKMEPFDSEIGTSVKSNAFWNEGEKVYDSNVLQPLTTESVFLDVIGTNVRNDAKDIDDKVASGTSPIQIHQISDKITMQPHGGMSDFSVTPDREVDLSVGSECIRKNKKLLEPHYSSVNSQVAKQSEEPSTSVSKTLHMMFPKDFNLPSKEELVKKFRRFGLVDNLKTKTYFYGRSARVVFFDPTDAVVAYRYARRKHLFGQTNVRYWLDPFEQERKGTVSQLGSITKSCLKRSNRPGYEERRKHQKVRFLMET